MIKKIAFIFFVLLVITACTKTVKEEPAGPDGCTKVIGEYGGVHWACPGGVHYFEPPAHWNCWVNWHGRRVCRWVD